MEFVNKHSQIHPPRVSLRFLTSLVQTISKDDLIIFLSSLRVTKLAKMLQAVLFFTQRVGKMSGWHPTTIIISLKINTAFNINPVQDDFHDNDVFPTVLRERERF